MAKSVITIDVYHFNSVGNAFTGKETKLIPMPILSERSSGPDGQNRVKSKILYGENYQQEVYVGQSVEELATLINT